MYETRKDKMDANCAISTTGASMALLLPQLAPGYGWRVINPAFSLRRIMLKALAKTQEAMETGQAEISLAQVVSEVKKK